MTWSPRPSAVLPHSRRLVARVSSRAAAARVLGQGGRFCVALPSVPVDTVTPKRGKWSLPRARRSQEGGEDRVALAAKSLPGSRVGTRRALPGVPAVCGPDPRACLPWAQVSRLRG